MNPNAELNSELAACGGRADVETNRRGEKAMDTKGTRTIDP